MLGAVYATGGRQFVRPPVCHTRALYQNGWTYHQNSYLIGPSL